jgi:hypothetical protein
MKLIYNNDIEHESPSGGFLYEDFEYFIHFFAYFPINIMLQYGF